MLLQEIRVSVDAHEYHSTYLLRDDATGELSINTITRWDGGSHTGGVLRLGAHTLKAAVREAWRTAWTAWHSYQAVSHRLAERPRTVYLRTVRETWILRAEHEDIDKLVDIGHLTAWEGHEAHLRRQYSREFLTKDGVVRTPGVLR